jgi:hypothetical protein
MGNVFGSLGARREMLIGFLAEPPGAQGALIGESGNGDDIRGDRSGVAGDHGPAVAKFAG